ncbi:MAG TPA: dihydrodipicolinate synthase family protein [Chthonomonadaceae bacterium]|nr:dihydrodipicolinate synthase family protein [Chthonomonadaceae bacterium]
MADSELYTSREALRNHLMQGHVIPAHPLALTAERKLDAQHQRALTRYYVAAGAGGMAVGVHTTQFAIRERKLYMPVLELASLTADEALAQAPRPFVKIAGICGQTDQAIREAITARALGYDVGLVSLSEWECEALPDDLVNHCKRISKVIPIMGFYLQAAVGGCNLPYRFWRRLTEEVEDLVAIKIAPFNRYQTLDVVRAVLESGRTDIALYTGNDDNIVADLLTEYTFPVDGKPRSQRIVGGLLGHWAMDTRCAVELLQAVKYNIASSMIDPFLLARGVEITDANAAYFDAAHNFRGCLPGIHTVLKSQFMMEGTWCLDPRQRLSQYQQEEILRVRNAYPHLIDDAFINEHRDEWLK